MDDRVKEGRALARIPFGSGNEFRPLNEGIVQAAENRLETEVGKLNFCPKKDLFCGLNGLARKGAFAELMAEGFMGGNGEGVGNPRFIGYFYKVGPGSMVAPIGKGLVRAEILDNRIDKECLYQIFREIHIGQEYFGHRRFLKCNLWYFVKRLEDTFSPTVGDSWFIPYFQTHVS